MNVPLKCPDWTKLVDLMEGSNLLHVGLPYDELVARCRGNLNYLATPYSKVVIGDDGCWDIGLSVEASVSAARYSLRLAVDGVTAISPILHSVEMIHADLGRTIDPLDDVFWTRWCRPLLAASGAVIVPTFTGWNTSKGIWDEVTTAIEAMKPVYLMDGHEI